MPDQWPNALAPLLKGRSVLQGEGVNHEGQAFSATLVGRPLLEGAALLIWFSARTTSGVLLHEEIMLAGAMTLGEFGISTISSNVRRLQTFGAGRTGPDTPAAIFFATGPDYDQAIELSDHNGALEVAFRWRGLSMTSEAVSRARLLPTDDAAAGAPI